MGSEELSFDENDRFYINTMYVSNRNKAIDEIEIDESIMITSEQKHQRSNTIAQP